MIMLMHSSPYLETYTTSRQCFNIDVKIQRLAYVLARKTRACVKWFIEMYILNNTILHASGEGTGRKNRAPGS